MPACDTSTPRVSLHVAVLTISDRRHAGNDESGDYLAKALKQQGHRCTDHQVCPENIYQIRKVISDWIARDDVQVILTNGGTGFSHHQATVQAIRPLLDHAFTGFGELFRHLSYLDIGTSSLQSDAFGGMANNTLLFCLPGSPNACKLAWERILKEQLDSHHRPCNFASHYHA
jgi:molybdenum cofactor biosynthesis protein B